MNSTSDQDAIGKFDIPFRSFAIECFSNRLETATKIWSDLHVSDSIIRSLVEQKFFDPTPIQRLTLPAAIRDRLDIIGAAETVMSSSSRILTISSLAHRVAEKHWLLPFQSSLI